MKHILAVDDEPEILTIIVEALSEYSIMVQTARSASAAVTQLRARDFDLVVTAASMLTSSGFDLLQTMNQEFPDIPVVVMSGDAGLRFRAILKGADGILPKPFTLTELVMTVHSHVFNLAAPR